MKYLWGSFELNLATRYLSDRDEVVHLEPKVFEFLAYLISNRERVVSKEEVLDHVWGSRFVSESSLHTAARDARRAVGDSGKAQHTIRTAHGAGYQFVADAEAEPSAPGNTSETSFASHRAAGEELDLTIKFVKARGPVSLAVGETGDGPPLLKTATWMTQVDKDTDQSPIWGHWVRGLSRSHRYIRYDPRGCGLSDRNLRDIPLDDIDLWVEDLGAVLDALDLDRVALLGASQGGPVAISFAARYPERVSRLILYGTYARGMTRRRDPLQSDQAALQVDLARVGWAATEDMFREIFAKQFVPDADPSEVEWFNQQLRLTTDAKNAPQLEAAFQDVDVSDAATEIAAPTVVMHSTGDAVVPFEEGRRLAGIIPGARFVPLESSNHILLERDDAFGQFIREIERHTLGLPLL